MHHASTDVLVAGGGPAGAAAAIALAQSGLRVLLVERSTYGSFRPGEALPPYTSLLLDQLGVRERFLASDARPAFAIRSAWGAAELAEQHFILNPYGDGWHIDRRRFDAMLADAAVDAGATVVRGATVSEVARVDDGFAAVIAGPGGSRREQARVIVDATGRGARVARALGARAVAYDRLVGLMGVLAPGAAIDEESEVLLLEATADGWWYSAPLPAGGLLVAFMTDSDELARSGLRPGTRWARALSGARHTSARAEKFLHVEDVRVRRASTSRLDRAAGDGWIAVGDAASAYDPLSAEGVCKAIESGLRGGDAVGAHLTGNNAALANHAARVDVDFQHYLRERARYYGVETRWPGSLFWQRRRAPDPESLPLALDPRAFVVAVQGAPAAAFAAAEGLLAHADAAWLATMCAEPLAAHELLARFKARGPLPVPDRSLIAALQLLIAGGAMRVVGPSTGARAA
jgi:flavin-dependent dehydrogenase